jgi:hypothetical protein
MASIAGLPSWARQAGASPAPELRRRRARRKIPAGGTGTRQGSGKAAGTEPAYRRVAGTPTSSDAVQRPQRCATGPHRSRAHRPLRPFFLNPLFLAPNPLKIAAFHRFNGCNAQLWGVAGNEQQADKAPN